MSSILVALVHSLFDLLLGWALLCFRSGWRPQAAHLPAAFLLGLYVETLFVGSLVLSGVPLTAAVGVMVGVALAVVVVAWRRGVLQSPVLSLPPLKWYEWLVLVSIAEKLIFAAWQLTRVPLYFDDASTHWAGRARALFSGFNWSLDPNSPVRLGVRGGLGHPQYPLMLIVWRAESAVVNGSWDDFLARADGWFFLLVIVATVWFAVWQFSQTRWFAALAAFATAAVPHFAWHAAAGYSDIAVAAFAIAALAALLRGEWGLGGILAAGSAWAKNDGLVLVLPAMFVASLLLPRWGERRRAVGWFLVGCATLTPWFLAKAALGLGVTPNDNKLAWHPEAIEQIWDLVITGPTSSILWIGVAIAILGSGRKLFRDSTGRALLAAFTVTCAALYFVFGCTDAYVFLENQMTIHRSVLQIAPVAILVSFYAVWLQIRDWSNPTVQPKNASPQAKSAGGR